VFTLLARHVVHNIAFAALSYCSSASAPCMPYAESVRSCSSLYRHKLTAYIVYILHTTAGVHPTVLSYTAAIQACQEHGKSDSSALILPMLQDMQQRGLQPDDHVYGIAIAGLASAGT
jgi:hypothetical protein